MMAPVGAVDGRVPGYLGRVLDGDWAPTGTCFQVAPGVLVTAWHVLDDIGAVAEGAQVGVDPLAGGERFSALVARLDPLRDLAVLTCDTALSAVAGPLAVTDHMRLRTPVHVTGHAVVDDREHTYQFLDAPGEWAGGTTRDNAVPLGRMTAGGVVPGMSGAPVIRDEDGAVAGVVSGRYNSADGWLAGTVWVARSEDLAVLLDGVADVPVARPLLAGPADVLLTVTAQEVQLTGPSRTVAEPHSGVRAGLAEAVHEVRRDRDRAGLSVRGDTGTLASVEGAPLSRAARLLGESFLPEPISRELDAILAAAEQAYQPVRIGLAVPPELAGLPWEALPRPDGRGPLALHPLVSVYRKTSAAPTRRLAGPLRVVVAIAAPDVGGGAVLDYERELRNVLGSVRAARADAADVRVVPFATPAAIRAELDRAPAHVLHISGHGSPGRLYLENEDGSACPVSAGEFLELAIPAGKMPPVITLSACYTDAAGAQDGTSFAAALCARGAAAVIATEASITDMYATRLLARVYGTLAQASDPDVIGALAQARRQVQDELETSPSPRDHLLAGLGEWAAVTVLAAAGSVLLLDAGQHTAAVPRPARPKIAGLADRDDWYFVGRRAEQRHWPAELIGPGTAGIVICGIGGTGKTTLAAELTARVQDREPGRVLVSLAGPLTLEALLGAVTTAIRRRLLISGGHDAEAVQALDVAGRADISWQDRLAILREYVLARVPMLVLLDNFEDNLRPDGDSGYAVGDEALGGLLAAWAADPGAARLLVTCRYRFTLPGGAERFLSFRQLGALSRAETMKLAWSLPALDRLDQGQLEHVWRLAGGHPRSLEYVDALLSGGTARYPDVTARLHAAVTARLGEDDRDQWLAARTGLDAALAGTVALAADDVLLEDLLTRLDQVPGAADLLLGVSVYREPADANAVLFQAGQLDQDAEHIPDSEAARERITHILTAAGIIISESLDLASVPARVQAELAPHLAELGRRLAPPFRPRADMPAQIAACEAASLLTTAKASDGQERFFVHRWTATELAARAASQAGGRLAHAHRQAAAYWQWRVRVWPQDRAADVHDLLEARYHLLVAGDAEAAGQVTEEAVAQLHAWGAWDQEASLIHDTLARLSAASARRTAWIQQLGVLAHQRGDYEEAARQYQRALDIFERLGDQVGMAGIYHNLGALAELQGDYEEAARQYQRALDIFERLGDQSGMANGYYQLGVLAQFQGDYEEAAGQYQRSLDIEERLGNQEGMAISYHQLGNLAQEREDYEEAARQYQRALDIFERLGDQAGMASCYHNLGALAQERGDYEEAARQYQRSLDIEERLGNQAGLASSYHQLGNLAREQGDREEAARQYQRSLDIKERLGDQAGMASSYHNLGILAHERGDYEEAARQYQRSLDIEERLGDQAGMATTYHNLGILEKERGGKAATAAMWHLRALAIRLTLRIPPTASDLRRLGQYRRKLGTEPFNSLLATTAGNPDLAHVITTLLDRLDKSGSGAD